MFNKAIKNILLGSFSLPFLSGCASIVSGGHQTISITTNPPGAKCAVYRDGIQIGSINSTPGSVTVSRKESDLTIGCLKEHYDFSNAQNTSDVNGWVFGNIGFGGLIGVVVDMATGAVRAYDHKTTVDMIPLSDKIAAPVGLPDQFPGPITRVTPISSGK
ncbi:hypothetical protein [Acetobacter orientalis]|uniref:Lipoprotein n=1 Tax=Acetobacter orientalis TaxID=146474 RepID=A0A0D6NNI5_9PROT|nr:hypothetical protein [Acetobacter orientalis]GAN66971.1 hypothetical protein Abor_034_002 [Acetobacter orientalis]GBR14876.1 hypothetical protein AA0481_0719 [Acetobacter orientalis NRIC 0481]GEL62703.1 hypothetical protein AOR02nite_25450 [Acetobacter orientalis]